MAKAELPHRWDLVKPGVLFKDRFLWLFTTFSLTVGVACGAMLPPQSQQQVLELFLNVISVFFGVGIAAFGLVFGLLTGEIFRQFADKPAETQEPLDTIIGKFWFIFSFDCIALLVIFLCIPLFFLGIRSLSLIVVATLALLIIGSTYNLLNTAFDLLGVIRKLKQPEGSDQEESDYGDMTNR